MKKTNFIPALFAVIMAVFFLVSCQKEVPTPASSNTEAIVLPDATFKKQIEIQDAIGNLALFEVGASSESLLSKFDQNSLSFDFNIDSDNTTATHDDDNTTTTPAIDKNRQLVTIQLLGYKTTNNTEIESYRINFSEGIKAVIKSENAAMRINLTPTTNINNKTEGWWYYTPYCGKVNTYGDGGIKQTGVTVYKAFLSGSIWYQAAVHTFYFYNNSTCNKCAHNVTYLDDIWVFQDVLTSVSIFASC